MKRLPLHSSSTRTVRDPYLAHTTDKPQWYWPDLQWQSWLITHHNHTSQPCVSREQWPCISAHGQQRPMYAMHAGSTATPPTPADTQVPVYTMTIRCAGHDSIWNCRCTLSEQIDCLLDNPAYAQTATACCACLMGPSHRCCANAYAADVTALTPACPRLHVRSGPPGAPSSSS